MKKSTIYYSLIILFFSVLCYSSESPTGVQQRSSWFSYITTPFTAIGTALKNGFNSVKNYLIALTPSPTLFTITAPVKHEEVKPTEASSATTPIPIESATPSPTQPTEIPMEAPSHAPKETTVHQKDDSAQVLYNCREKRLEITRPDNLPHYFNFVDSYVWSPQKKYILATEFTTSGGQLVTKGVYKKTSTQLINPVAQEKIATFNNIFTYEFSPEETKLSFLTSDTTIWQTFGITKPSTKHEEPTGIIKKQGEIFTYHIYDIPSKKIVKSFENCTGIAFNNETEISVYFEDGAVEVHQLGNIMTTFLRSPSQPLPQKIKYIPHEKKLTLFNEKVEISFTNIERFYLSPQKKYLFTENAAGWAEYLNNKVKDINTNTPSIQLIHLETMQSIKNFQSLWNIVNYEMSPEETTLLCRTRVGQQRCIYKLFDLKQQDLIMDTEEIKLANTIHFKNENELQIIDQDNNIKSLPIDHSTLQKDELLEQVERIEEKFSSAVQSTVQKTQELLQSPTTIVSAAVEPIKKQLSPITEKFATVKEAVKKQLTPIAQKVARPFLEKMYHATTPTHELEEVIIEPAEETEEEFFESVMEQYMLEIKQHIIHNKQAKKTSTMEKIFNELLDDNKEDAHDARDTFLQQYALYEPPIQQKFINELLSFYTQKSAAEKTKLISLLFTQPEGIKYSSINKTSTKNVLNTIVASIHNKILMITDRATHKALGVFPLSKTVRALLFNPSGSCLVVSYKKLLSDESAPLDVFIKQQDGKYAKKDISVAQSSEIIGLLFMDDNTLLTLDTENKLSFISLHQLTIQKESAYYIQAKKIIQKIQDSSRGMQSADVVSAEIMQSLKDLLHQLQETKQTLTEQEKRAIEKEEQTILQQYQPTYSKVIKNLLTSAWKSHQSTIMQVVYAVIIPAISVSIIPLLQASTGNAALDIPALQIAAFSSIFATNMMELSSITPPLKEMIRGAEYDLLSKTLATYTHATTKFPAPSAMGIIKGALFATIGTEIQHIIDMNGGINTLLKTYTKQYIIRSVTTKPQEKEFFSTASNYIHSFIHKEQIESLIAQITYMTATSACIGIGMYFVGLGFNSEQALMEVLYYNALRGVAQATMRYAITTGIQKTGALITLPTSTISTALINYIAKDQATFSLSSQDAATTIIHACVAKTVQLMTDEAGTFYNLLSKTSSNIKESLSSHWASMYDIFSIMTSGFTEVNPPQENEPAVGY